jgi:hypothetical protein
MSEAFNIIESMLEAAFRVPELKLTNSRRVDD